MTWQQVSMLQNERIIDKDDYDDYIGPSLHLQRPDEGQPIQTKNASWEVKFLSAN